MPEPEECEPADPPSRYYFTKTARLNQQDHYIEGDLVRYRIWTEYLHGGSWTIGEEESCEGHSLMSRTYNVGGTLVEETELHEVDSAQTLVASRAGSFARMWQAGVNGAKKDD